MKAVIMCGGSGTRLWPISRKEHPKQFAPLFGQDENKKSLFELTIERNMNLVEEFIIVVNEVQLPLCKQQIPHIIKDKVKFIIEPIGRNTAPAVTLAALLATEDDLLILASDHLIKNQNIYEECVRNAQRLSKKNQLVTFGITAKYPETGYGYIEADGNSVLSFKEKPDHATAEKYISAGNYFWNSGMFFFNAQLFLSEIEKYSPEVFQTAQTAFSTAKVDGDTYYIAEDKMKLIPSISIDYAVMEKSDSIKVIPSQFDWSDLGSFESIYTEYHKDENGNAVNSKHISIDSKDNLIIGHEKLICTYNISDLIIIDTKDALLIGKKGHGQKVKDILAKVKEKFKNLD